MSASTAIAGVTPRDVVTPRDLDELTATVRALHAERKPFAFVGGGTELELGNAPRALDTVVRTVALDSVIEYVPEDQLITVEAGMTLAEIDRVLEERGQMLPLGVGDRERATIGGAISTNAYGRRRQRYGTAKDLIVGVEIVRPDGVRARGGGKVVKNVAGFDLPKLMVGSLGTLGAIVRATMRVYPIPEARRTFVLTGDRDFVDEACGAIVAARMEPESAVLYDGTTLVLTFAGTHAGVDAQAAMLLSGIGATARSAAEASPEQAEGYDARERAVRGHDDWRLRITTPPRAHGRVAPLDAAAGAVGYLLLGVDFRGFASDAAPAAMRGAGPGPYIDDLRAGVRATTGGEVVVHAMPAEARTAVDAWGPPPPSLPLMRAIKWNFDPLGLCNIGRFVGGI
jgi:glycolate dehydrogenase FAD-binding subunit